jgi:3-hydroxyacyl-CoA dehydrogenase/enoyl-CoA hydratase/3-hydroxybutyryl-CoA epimerase
MKTIRYELADGIATLTFDEPGSPVNTMCLQWQEDLTEAAVQQVLRTGRDPRHRAGLRQEHLLRRRRPEGHHAPEAGRCAARVPRDRAVKKNFRTLETLGKPVVACLNGAALGRRLGSGAGRALPRCRRQRQDPVRPAGDHAGPDPRRLGHHQDDAPARAWWARSPTSWKASCSRRAKALELGWCTNWCRRGPARRGAGLDRANPQAQQPWDAKDYRMPGGTPSNPKIAGAGGAPAALKQKTRGLYPAPEAALAAMVEGARSTSTPRCASRAATSPG